MDEKREQARKEIKRSLPSLAVGVALGFLTTLYDLYKLASTSTNLSQVLGAVCSLAAGILLVLAVLALLKESKAVLALFLSGLTLGLFRWFIIDHDFQPTIPAFILLALFAWLTWRIISWIQVKALS